MNIIINKLLYFEHYIKVETKMSSTPSKNFNIYINSDKLYTYSKEMVKLKSFIFIFTKLCLLLEKGTRVLTSYLKKKFSNHSFLRHEFFSFEAS